MSKRFYITFYYFASFLYWPLKRHLPSFRKGNNKLYVIRWIPQCLHIKLFAAQFILWVILATYDTVTLVYYINFLLSKCSQFCTYHISVVLFDTRLILNYDESIMKAVDKQRQLLLFASFISTLGMTKKSNRNLLTANAMI